MYMYMHVYASISMYNVLYMYSTCRAIKRVCVYVDQESGSEDSEADSEEEDEESSDEESETETESSASVELTRPSPVKSKVHVLSDVV